MKIYIVIEKKTGAVWAFGSKKAIYERVSDRYGLPLHFLHRHLNFDADGRWENKHLIIFVRNIVRIKQKIGRNI